VSRSRNRNRHRRRTSLIAYGAGAAVLATLATYGTLAMASPGGGGADAEAASASSALQADFASAAQEFKVPQSVLMAVSYRQTLWDAHAGKPSATGNYNVMGLTQVRPQDLEQPAAADRLAEMNLSGDPAISRHFDAARALKADPAQVDTSDPRLHTLDAAADLIGASADELRSDSRQSVRGAAALLAQWEKEAYGSLPADAGRWYPAVARYSQSPDAGAADRFAQRVFASIRTGESRVTDDGQQVVLPADPSVKPVKVGRQALTVKAADATTAAVTADCPSTLSCAWVPAAFKLNSSATDDWGNYNPASRVAGPPAAGAEDIRYIVVHDMEGSYEGSIQEFQNPAVYASAHYLVADDGRVTQMVQNKDEAWHAANKTVNMHSIGVEDEGYAMKAGSWYSEQEYETSATLVKYLAQKFHVPLDRQHIIGHDEVPGVLDPNVASQHWDPGPYWDWNHYMALMGVPQGDQGAGGVLKTGQLVRIVPPYTTANQPTLTNGGTAFAAHPANFVYLYTSASTSGAKNTDPYLGTGPAWSEGSNWADKAVTGSEYVVAGTSGNDWTAIWYAGKKLWFYNPGGQWTAPVGTTGQTVVKPKAGTSGYIPVYGRAYPEQAAYSGTGVPVQAKNDDPLTKYGVPLGQGQAYALAGPEAAGDYYYAGTYAGTATGDRTLVSGTQQFYPIQFNHRIAWVKASDVVLSTSTTPDSGATRSDLMVRDSSGNLWQYQGTGKSAAPFLSRYKVGPGWNTYNQVTRTTPLRANGTGNLVGRDSTGTLWYYTASGNISKPFTGRSKVGTGWNQYNLILGGGDVNGDGKGDLLVRDSTGTLYYHPGADTATHFSARTKIGTGWQQYNALISPGDMTGDGKADLLVRDASGTLWLYQGTGKPASPYLTRTKAGTGWQSYTKILGVGDITGDGKPDILARTSDGTLYVHPGTGSATAPYGSRLKIGTGWNQYNLFS
jgi:hypothetical protein